MWTSEFPSVIRAGTTVKWRDDSATVPFDQNATSTDGWSLVYYLRTNTASEGHISVGSAYNSGWQFTINATDTGNFDKGDWSWTAIVDKGGEKFQLAVGEFKVKESLAYSGTPGALDTRTQNEIELDYIKVAIPKFEDNWGKLEKEFYKYVSKNKVTFGTPAKFRKWYKEREGIIDQV